MPTASSSGAIRAVSVDGAEFLESAVTATSDRTSIGMAPTAILKASAPARLITSSTPLAPFGNRVAAGFRRAFASAAEMAAEHVIGRRCGRPGRQAVKGKGAELQAHGQHRKAALACAMANTMAWPAWQPGGDPRCRVVPSWSASPSAPQS